MIWLLFPRKSRRSSRAPAASPGKWALRAGALLAAAVAAWGSFEVKRRVDADERFRLEAWRVETGDLPEWVTPEIQGQIEAAFRSGPEAGWNLLAPGVLRNVRAAFESSPWVEEVSGMRLEYPVRESPGVVAMNLRLRRPVALVEHGNHYYLADAEGRRLGEPYREPPGTWFGVPTVMGLAAPGPEPVAGERWASRDVEQGIEVARVLFESGILREFPELPIHAIDLSNLHGRRDRRESEIVLWRGSQRLAWGRSPISAAPRTVSVPELVANLRFVLSHPETYGGYALIHLHRKQEDLTGVRG